MASGEHPLPPPPAHDTIYTQLPVDDVPSPLFEPRPPFLSSDPTASPPNPSFRDSYAQSTPNDSGMLLSKPEADGGEPADLVADQKPRRRPLLFVLIALAILAILIIVVVVPVYFTVIKPKSNASVSSPSGSPTASAAHPTSSKTPSTTTVWGGDGTTVRTTNGSTFTYHNKFGGIWYYDQNDPYKENAYPNSWTPPLNTTWNFATNRINGVNLGGWFVLEPFITPALFQKYPTANDEWSISTLMAADTASGGLNQLEEHYKTFITEDDIAEIAGAGLNWVRIPIPFWAIDAFDNEPFLKRTSWKYILQALQWCRKYGLRVKIDMHTVPGSQNGYNHSGKYGQVNFLRGTMGYANAQRILNYIRIFTEFFSQPEWKNIIVIFGIMNEPRPDIIGADQLRAFHYQVYTMMREITGVGEGRGPYIAYHDPALSATTPYLGFLAGADRVIQDGHPYFAFDQPPSTDPIDTGLGVAAGGTWPAKPCERWAAVYNSSRNTYGVAIAGEWSNAINDCGLFVVGTDRTPTFTGDCALWLDSSGWTDGVKAGVMRVAMATMDATRDWFFWNWKIAPSTSGIVGAPAWSYQLGLRGGWMPTDPRTAIGTCGAPVGPPFAGSFAPWMTGGAGAGALATRYDWPPATLISAAAPVAGLPRYTATGTINTLPVPTYTDSAGKSIVSGSGWVNPSDNTPAPTTIPGCVYPSAWDALGAAVPAGCGAGGAAVRRHAAPTAMPEL